MLQSINSLKLSVSFKEFCHIELSSHKLIKPGIATSTFINSGHFFNSRIILFAISNGFSLANFCIIKEILVLISPFFSSLGFSTLKLISSKILRSKDRALDALFAMISFILE